MKKEKEYEVQVDIKFSQFLSAKNKKEAIKIVKESFYDSYGLKLDKSEIKKVVCIRK